MEENSDDRGRGDRRHASAVLRFAEEDYLETFRRFDLRWMLRLGWTWGMVNFALLGIFMALSLGMAELGTVMATLGICLTGGTFYGCMMGFWVRWLGTRFYRELLDRPGHYFGAQPLMEEEGPILEILAGQKRGRHSAGGRLVLTGRALWFQPHNQNDRADRSPVRIPLDSVEDFQLVDRDRFQAWLLGAQAKEIPRLLEIHSGTTVHTFDLDRPEMLMTLLETLQQQLPGADEVCFYIETGRIPELPPDPGS